MAHFLHPSEVRDTTTRKPYAAVRVKVVKLRPRVLQLDPDPENPIMVLKSDARIAPLPENVTLLDLDGEDITKSATGRYWVTTETFNPFHAVLDDHALFKA